jgi:hypothetical protein
MTTEEFKALNQNDFVAFTRYRAPSDHNSYNHKKKYRLIGQMLSQTTHFKHLADVSAEYCQVLIKAMLVVDNYEPFTFCPIRNVYGFRDTYTVSIKDLCWLTDEELVYATLLLSAGSGPAQTRTPV